MDDQANEEDDKEVVRVPEDLKVAAADDLHGGGDDEDESECDDDACDPGQRCEHKVGGSLEKEQKSKCIILANHIESWNFNRFHRNGSGF